MKKFLLCFALVGLLTACGEIEEPEVVEDTVAEPVEEKKEEVKTEFKVGEKIKLDDNILTVTKVEKSKGNEWDTPKQGSEYTIIHVKIENGGSENISYNPFDFQIKNSQGQITESTFTTIDQDTTLNAGELASGGTVQGTIPFETPVDDKGLQLIYQPNFWLESDVITVNLQ